MGEPALRADCTRCNGLCCVYLAFDRSELFAFDKAAGTPCRHLSDDCRCAIHADLARRGFAGCSRYDCLGAGQRVVQELFGGRSWREGAAVAAAMFSAFRTMRTVHELLLLLRQAGALRLTSDQAELCRTLQDALAPSDGWSQDSLAAFGQGGLADEVRAFLRSLKPHVLIATPSREP
jgi:hypothetical protein